MNKTIKIALSCAVVLLFVGGTIVVAEYLRSVSALHTNQIAVPTGGMSPNGCYINKSDLDKAVISSGTITVPISNTTNPTEDEINERHNISRNAIMSLTKEFNVPDNETVTLGCDFKNGTCTYQIVKPVKANC